MFSFLYRYDLSVAVSCRHNISQHKQIMAIHDVCRILFQSELNYMNACDKAEAELPQSPERDYLIDFIRSSERGCIKPYQNKTKAE